MHLIDVDHIGTQPPQGILDLFDNAGAACTTEGLAVFPVEAGLGCDHSALPAPVRRKRFADDLLRVTETVDRCRIN